MDAPLNVAALVVRGAQPHRRREHCADHPWELQPRSHSDLRRSYRVGRPHPGRGRAVAVRWVCRGGEGRLVLAHAHAEARIRLYQGQRRNARCAAHTRVRHYWRIRRRVGCVYIVRASLFAARVAVSCLMVPYAKPLPQRDDDDGRPAARARGACSPPQRPPRPRAFRCCTMCSRWDGACATGSSSHRRRAVRATLFAFPPPARLELTAQRSRRRRYAPLHALAYPECAEHLPVVLVYSGRLTRHCPRLLHPAIQGTTIELGDADGAAAVTDQRFGATSKWAVSSWLALMAAEVRRRARSMYAARAVRLGSQTIVLKQTAIKGDQPLPRRRHHGRRLPVCHGSSVQPLVTSAAGGWAI